MAKRYNGEYDSYYDDEKDIWLEKPCQYEDCEFCSNRPTKPSQTKPKTKSKGYIKSKKALKELERYSP